MSEEVLAAEVPLLEPAPGIAEPGRERVDLTRGRYAAGDRLAEVLLAAATVFSGLVVAFVAFFVLQKGLPTLLHQGWSFVLRDGWDDDLATAWDATARVAFHARPLILGTLLSTGGALLFTLILGLGSSIALVEFVPPVVRRPLESIVQLLAGIPSVVYGLIGFTVVVPFISAHVLPANAADAVPQIPYDGQSLLAAVIVLTFMIMPFFVSVASDALRAVPRSLTDGGRALGLTHWRVVAKVQVPLALPGIIAGAVLAAARGIGEAIALSMVAGSLALSPTFSHGPLYALLTPMRTMASAIVEAGGEAGSIPTIRGALFAVAAMLLLASLALSLAARAAYAWSARRLSLVDERTV